MKDIVYEDSTNSQSRKEDTGEPAATGEERPASNLFEVSDRKTIERLVKIGTALSVERNLHELLKMIIEELKFVVSADKASLFLIDNEKFELIFDVTSDEVLHERRIPLNRKSLAGYVAMTGETLRIDDVYEISEQSPYRFNYEIDKQTGYRTKSIISLPMIDHKNERIGVVQLINKTVNNQVVPFDSDDESLLKAMASQAAVSIENTMLYNAIEIFFASFVRALASAIEARDPVTKGHSRRVAMYTEAIAKSMNCFSDAELKELSYAAWLHDVGKIGVREHILSKRDRLSEAEMKAIQARFNYIEAGMRMQMAESLLSDLEKDPGLAKNLPAIVKEREKAVNGRSALLRESLSFVESKNKSGFMDEKDIRKIQDIAEKTYTDPQGAEQHYLEPHETECLCITKGNLTEPERTDMNNHVVFTWDILREIPFTKELKNVPHYASLHHEKLDGSGYPFGYPAEKIPLQARILAVADIYDALTAQDRPYKKPVPQGKSLDILEEQVQKGILDRNVFITFIKDRIFTLEDHGDEFSFLSKILDEHGNIKK